jgi:hypothetical protein
MKFDNKYFQPLNFTKEQVKSHFSNANKDLGIAQRDTIPEVKFSYAYSALIKAGLTVLSHFQQKIKSVPGHHIKIIAALSQLLKDESIDDLGNAMRSKRNLDMYSGGLEITEKECREYLDFVEGVLDRVKSLIS